MGRVLLTYEFGAGLGHLSPLIGVARKLSPEHRLVFCLPEPEMAEREVRQAFGDRAEIRRIERWKDVPGGPSASHTLADLFWTGGFGDPDQVRARIQGWREIYGEVGPDLILADFAPGARLAAAGRPFVEVGYAFTVPPGGRSLPPMHPGQKNPPLQSRAREFELLANVRQALAFFGEPGIEHFADLFRGDDTFVCGLPAFDMYAAWREDPYLPPIMQKVAVGPPPAERPGPDVFAYLHANHPRLRELTAALTLTGRRVGLYVSGAPAERIASLCGRNVGVLVRPADLADMLPKVRLSIHHGGLGSAHAGLAAGTVQLMFATRLERRINARAVEQLGGGRRGAPEPTGDPQRLAELITSLLDDTAFQERARKTAIDLRPQFEPDTASIVADACERRLAAT
jgi:UDP:flavonoid glycosyltransferase YjiC (YdhE family)